jgi:lipopolysaccharide/colanic/teichoic acid biosynthesis glycosyltransferase
MPSRIYYRTLDLLASLKALMRIRVVSRTLDVLASLVALYLLTPLTFLIWLAIRLEDGGLLVRTPTVCKQRRTGLDGRTYHALRFRTMRGERVTRVGAVIRWLHFDELPQIFNVLHGDVSFILKNDRTLRF